MFLIYEASRSEKTDIAFYLVTPSLLSLIPHCPLLHTYRSKQGSAGGFIAALLNTSQIENIFRLVENRLR